MALPNLPFAIRRMGQVLAVSLAAFTACQPQYPAETAATVTTEVKLAASAPVVAADTAAAPCQPEPLRFLPGSRAMRRPQVVRRYVGTVGGEPATATLIWQNPDSVTGSFYLHQRGPNYTLNFFRKPSGPFALDVAQEDIGYYNMGTWHLIGRPGRTLTGFWLDTTGRKRLLRLRENYAGAVQYEVRTLLLQGGKPESGGDSDYRCSVPSCQREFPHLLAPQAVHPALQRVLNPSLAERRRLTRADYEFDGVSTYVLHEQLNGFGLLSYVADYSNDPFGGRPQYGVASFLLDLTTGQPLTLASQLRPGYSLPLRRLLTHHLLHDPQFDQVNKQHTEAWDWQDSAGHPVRLVLLPHEDPSSLSTEALFLTGAGLAAIYDGFGMYKQPLMQSDVNVVVSYAELRPLVRPGTPLASMLRARGLW